MMRTKHADPKVALLRELPGLAAVRTRELATVAPLVEDFAVRSGAVLAIEGETCHQVLLILEGHATITVGGEVLGQAGPGDVVGDIALCDGVAHEATVTADGPMHLLVAGPESSRAFVRHPVIVRVVASSRSPRTR